MFSVKFLILRKTNQYRNAFTALQFSQLSSISVNSVQFLSIQLSFSYLNQMNSTLENVLVVQNFVFVFAFAQSVVNDSEDALHVFQNMQNQINNLKARVAIMITLSIFEISDFSSFSNSASFSFAFDSIYIATIITQAIAQVNQNQSFVMQFTFVLISLLRLSEKLFDIIEYDEDRDKLDAWEQTLKQKMHINHDRYFIDVLKIFYVEFRLIIKKKAHIFMSFYRIDDICIIFVFITYFRILRNVCENLFEIENARVYFRNTFKQNKMIFFEYYLIFVIKKNASTWMTTFSLSVLKMTSTSSLSKLQSFDEMSKKNALSFMKTTLNASSMLIRIYNI